MEDGDRTRQINRTASLLIRVRLNASSDLRGQLRDRLEMTFESTQPRKRFTITRPILARIGPKEDYDALQGSNPYIRRSGKKKAYSPYAKVHRGVRPQILAEITWARRLLGYDVPNDLANIIGDEGSKLSEKIRTVRSAFMRGSLSSTTYHYHFQAMLWIEEMRAQYVIIPPISLMR